MSTRVELLDYILSYSARIYHNTVTIMYITVIGTIKGGSVLQYAARLTTMTVNFTLKVIEHSKVLLSRFENTCRPRQEQTMETNEFIQNPVSRPTLTSGCNVHVTITMNFKQNEC